MLKIGISACFFHADPKRAVFKGKTLLYLEESMAHWIMSGSTSEGNVMAYMIPSVPKNSNGPKLKDWASEVGGLDGLVLQGGSDVSPTSYGETAMKPEWNGDAVRDAYEIELMKAFMAVKKPVLGVCRGAQLMNVGLGGTLYQDIEAQVEGSLNHRNWEIYDQNFHEIEFEPGSLLSKLYKNPSRKINTVHHQALKTLGKDLVVEAKSPQDGIIEAIRYTGDSFAFAVQWHPEFQDPNDKNLLDGKPILNEFLTAAEKARKK